MRLFITSFLLWVGIAPLQAQITVSGTVLDNSKLNYVEGVRVLSTQGKMSYTDSLGRYNITTQKGDSLFFIYNNKPTQKFAVNKIGNYNQFDIALLVPVKSKYSVLKEVVVYSKSYKEDSIENRQNYASIFSYNKPRFETSVVPGGGVGLDVNELINMFRFRRNKSLKKFQQRLETEEQEKYVNYRFSKNNVKRITQLKGAALDTFLVWYRPSYEFTSKSSEIQFNQYVLNASYHFKRTYNIGTGEAKLEKPTTL
ncbi:hypothetical protein ACFOWM_09105 [Ferruginibacter yonginensis]|uniref:Carboxypeptidase-like regulatory domain-containing protein n=1 Tax=Ferruginibacter yonginensis TaxID=1310416 RepID=A0ABV8QSH0_9BACT